MTNNFNLNELRNVNFCDYDKQALVDLRDISVDTGKAIGERFESFLHQVHNPYLFKVGDVVVKIAFSNGNDFCTALGNAVASA